LSRSDNRMKLTSGFNTIFVRRVSGIVVRFPSPSWGGDRGGGIGGAAPLANAFTTYPPYVTANFLTAASSTSTPRPGPSGGFTFPSTIRNTGLAMSSAR
jgi:hypothetical protein